MTIQPARLTASEITDDQLDALYAARDAAAARVAEYENAINWEASCTGCARLLDKLAEADGQRDLARTVAVALEQELANAEAMWHDWRRDCRQEAERRRNVQRILEDGPQTIDCGTGRTVVQPWSVVAQNALRALDGPTRGGTQGPTVISSLDGRPVPAASNWREALLNLDLYGRTEMPPTDQS